MNAGYFLILFGLLLLATPACSLMGDVDCRGKIEVWKENLRDQCRIDIRYKRCRIQVQRDFDMSGGRIPPEALNLYRRQAALAASMLCAPEYEECLETNGYGRINEKETCR